MGADIAKSSRSDINPENIKLKHLSPKSISKFRQTLLENESNIRIDSTKLVSILGLEQRESNILMEYFDMDGDGEINNYEFRCALAMLIYSSIDLKSEFIFKLYDFDSNNYLTKDEIINLVTTLYSYKKEPLVSTKIEQKANEILKEADLDLDNKLSLREFKSYININRNILDFLNGYESLAKADNIDDKSLIEESERTEKSEEKTENKDNKENPESDNNSDDYLEESLNIGDEAMDPDLKAELEKDEEAKKRNEDIDNIKKGVEYNNGFVEEDEIKGDEFAAIKPWLTNRKNCVPSNYKKSKLDGALPNAKLELEFVHGYRCHDTRNNLRYTQDNNIVYHTAAVGIVYDKESNSQIIFNEHFDDITSFAIHPKKKYVATGEIGPYPLISIWNSKTGEAKVRIKHPLQKGINHLCFSNDGKLLAASAADDDHNIAIFEWEKGSAENISKSQNHRLKDKNFKNEDLSLYLYSLGKMGRANILGMCFSMNGKKLACCGVNEVNIFEVTKGNMKKKKCTGLKGKELTSKMCCGYLSNDILICGSINGNLLICSGTTFTKSKKGHKNGINCLYIRDNQKGFLTGGGDGYIFIWDNKITITSKITIRNNEINSMNYRIRSVCENDKGNILVGTRGGEIIEFEGNKPKILLRGHFDGELWGLCPHPKKNIFFTVGEDKLLAVWDIKTKKLILKSTLEEKSKTIDCSPDCRELAIGCESGNFYIYDSIDLKLKYKITNKESQNNAIQILKYSPNGEILAVGGIDGNNKGTIHIFLYSTKKKYNLIKKLRGHTSRINHLDFSEDGEFIQSCSSSYELLYHSIETGKQITKTSSFSDTKWATWTCIFGWPVQGIWPECSSGDDINSCDVDKKRRVIVTGDDFSKVKLFRYPSPVEKAAYYQYNGHSSHVTCVRFMKDSKHVISIGGNDKAIFQFKISFNEQAKKEEDEFNLITEGDNNNIIDEENSGINFKEEEFDEGDEFAASKPWLGDLKASSPEIDQKTFNNSTKPPKENLKKLNYVFGYRSFDTRMNIKYTKIKNNIVYTTAALGILHNIETNKQKYFPYHHEDIVSLALHPNGYTVATGQMAQKGSSRSIDLFIWNIKSLPNETNINTEFRENVPEDVYNLKGVLQRAIRILKFNDKGTRLLGNGQDDFNSIAIWDTSNLSKISLISCINVDGARVLDATWLNENWFVSVGPKHIRFFQIKGRDIPSNKGIFGNIKVEGLSCVCAAFNKIYTGTIKGNLITWNGNKAQSCINICKNGSVFCLYHNKKENCLFAGGYDGVIIAYDNAKLNIKYKLDIQKITQAQTDCGIRAIDVNDSGFMLVGTRGGDIVEINLKSKKLNKEIMKSHCDKELWGLTVNPRNCNQIATGGGDRSLRIWDIKKNKQIFIKIIDEDFRAIDWASNGKFIIIGTLNGSIYHLNLENNRLSKRFESIFYAGKNGKIDKRTNLYEKWIQELKISPNSSLVAFGSHCGIGKTFSKVQILSIEKAVKEPLKNYCIIDPKITSALTHLDWGNDNDTIVINSLAYELKYISVSVGTTLSASDCVYNNKKWNTWTCLFGFPVQGIWPPGATGYDVNYTCRSNNQKVIATGDDLSLIKLFSCPSVVEQAPFKAYGGHSSHVTKIRFTPDDNFLVSVGGNDKSVFVWETDFGNNAQNKKEKNEETDEDEEEEEEEEEDDEEDNENELKPKEKKKEIKPEKIEKNIKNKKDIIKKIVSKSESDEEEEDEDNVDDTEKKKKSENKKENAKVNIDNKKTKVKQKEEESEESEDEEEEEEDDSENIESKKNEEEKSKPGKEAESSEEKSGKDEESEKSEESKSEEESEDEEEEEEEDDESNSQDSKEKMNKNKKYKKKEINNKKSSKNKSKKGRTKKSSENSDTHTNNLDERQIQQNNFNPRKWDEEEGNIGDLAINPAPIIIENPQPRKSKSQPRKSKSQPPIEQWRTTCSIKIPEPLIPDNEPPRLDIKPFYVFGYRAKDAHNNIKYLNNSTILYYSGKIGIVQNLMNNGQKYFNKHKNEISTMCINKNKNLIATGEDQKDNEEDKYSLRIWDANTLEENNLFFINYPIKALGFSNDDKYLVCVCLDEKHNVILIDIEKKEILDEVSGSEKKIIGIVFQNEHEFATVGISHFKFWIINENKLMCKEFVNTIDNFDDKLGVISISNEYFVTGSFLGYVTLWSGHINTKTKKCHNSQIDSLYSDNKLIISGARDKTISILDKDLTILNKIDMNKVIDPKLCINCSPKSLDIIKNSEIKKINKILIGTYSGDILELIFKNNIFDESDISYEIYNSSHFCENSSENVEITSINYSKKTNLFVTTGKDRTIRFWDPKAKRQTKLIYLEKDSYPTASDFSFDENLFVVGYDSGNIEIYSGKDISLIKSINERKSRINVIKCSKNNLIACATQDEKANNIIDVYFTSLNKFCTLLGAQNKIDGLDWSEDSKYLVTFSHEKECRIFSVLNDKFMISDYSCIDNYKWNSWTLGYGWFLKGYYDGKYKTAPIYVSDRFKLDKEEIYNIAIGDINGGIKLFKFPIINKEQKAVTNFNYHAKKIINMKFGNANNKFILLTSSDDGCLIAWEIWKI